MEGTYPIEERVSRLEGAYPSLATKAYVAQSENRLTERIGESDARADWLFAQVRAEIAASDARNARRVAESDARTARRLAEARSTQAFRDLMTEIAEYKSSVKRWTVANGVFIIAAITLIDRVF